MADPMTPTGLLATDYEGTGYVEETDASHDVDTMLVSRYPVEQHVYMMPITSPSGFANQTAAFVQLAAPTMAWAFDWTIMREGSRPAVPDPTPIDTNWVLLYATPEPMMVTVGVDGVTPVYRLSGTYVYGRKTAPSQIYDAVNFPRPPWVADVYQRGVSSSSLQKGLSDSAGGGGAAASPGVPYVPTGGPVRR